MVKVYNLENNSEIFLIQFSFDMICKVKYKDP